MKTTTLTKVLKFCRTHDRFTFKEFDKRFGPYPSTGFNYLSMLVHAGFVNRYARGKYCISFKPPLNITSSGLKERSYGTKKSDVQKIKVQPGDTLTVTIGSGGSAGSSTYHPPIGSYTIADDGSIQVVNAVYTGGTPGYSTRPATNWEKLKYRYFNLVGK